MEPVDLPELTIGQWFEHPELQAAWKKTWEMPHMKIAMGILRESCRYTNGANRPAFIEGIDPIQGYALLNAFREGGNELLSFIDKLGKSRNPIPKMAEDPKFFGTVNHFKTPPPRTPMPPVQTKEPEPKVSVGTPIKRGPGRPKKS